MNTFDQENSCSDSDGPVGMDFLPGTGTWRHQDSTKISSRNTIVVTQVDLSCDETKPEKLLAAKSTLTPLSINRLNSP